LSAIPQDVRGWWLAHGEPFKRAMRELAAILDMGLSPDEWPYLYRVPDSPKRVEMVLFLSAIRRYPGPTIAKALMQFHDEWDAGLKQLTVVVGEAVGA
jgi:hypothetical protein